MCIEFRFAERTFIWLLEYSLLYICLCCIIVAYVCKILISYSSVKRVWYKYKRENSLQKHIMGNTRLNLLIKLVYAQVDSHNGITVISPHKLYSIRILYQHINVVELNLLCAQISLKNLQHILSKTTFKYYYYSHFIKICIHIVNFTACTLFYFIIIWKNNTFFCSVF